MCATCQLAVTGPGRQDEAQSRGEAVEAELSEARQSQREQLQQLEKLRGELSQLQAERRVLESQLSSARAEAGGHVSRPGGLTCDFSHDRL